MLNPFFLQGSSGEQNLVQDLINEQIKIYGVEVYYLPREYVTEKTVMREVIESKFQNAYPLEAYVDNFNGYGGQGTILSKFGIQELDDLTLVISKERFQTYITPLMSNLDNIKTPFRPKEGDLVWFPLGDRLFEIKYVEHEKPFYQLQKNYTYELQCELFRYSNEVIDTDIEFIDDNTEDIGFITTLNLIGFGTEARAITNIVDGGVRYVNILNRGNGYETAPEVKFSRSPFGTVSTATGIATMISGIIDVCEPNPNLSRVQAVEIKNPGFGYTESPMISFIGGGGSGAAATTVIGNGIVGIITVTNGGSGYKVEPTVSFVGQATIPARGRAVIQNGTVTEIRIVDAGLGYTSTPSIIIQSPGPISAAATAIITLNDPSDINDYSLTGISLTKPGYGYTVAPSITVSQPDLNPEVAVAVAQTLSNSNFISFSMTNTGRFYTQNVVSNINYVGLQTNYHQGGKFTNYSYEIKSTSSNFNFNLASSSQSGLGGFWVYVPSNAPTEQDIMVINSGDGAGYSYNNNFYNGSFKIAFVLSSTGKASFRLDDTTIVSAASSPDLRDDDWHWIWFEITEQNVLLLKADGGSATAYGAGSTKALYAFKQTNNSYINNSYGNCGMLVDDIHFSILNSIPQSPPVAKQQSNQNTIYYNDFDNPQTFTGIVTTLGTKYSASGFLSLNPTSNLNHYIVGVTSISIPSPTGLKQNFTATAQSTVGTAGTISINITYGGGGYSVPPIITISNPLQLGKFEFNEIVVGEISRTEGRVKSWNAVSGQLELTNVTGEFSPKEKIIGTLSGAEYILFGQDNYNIDDPIDETDKGEQYAQNNEIQFEANQILDFSERNPFGMP